jgi:chromosomal replication initiation ATPase DnaA
MTAKPMPQQLVLALPHRQAQEADDFLVSRSNAAAVDLVDAWPKWPLTVQFVAGPAGSGKSHLANVWRLRSGADIVPARDLGDATVRAFEARRALVVEDIDRGISDEKILFHLMNLAREASGALLLTARVAPGEVAVSLPDLRSRLRATSPVMIDGPDEALIRAVLVKLFSDRQLAVEPHVIGHLALHMERSMEAAVRVVAACDRLSLAAQRRVTRAIAAEALASERHDEDGEAPA